MSGQSEARPLHRGKNPSVQISSPPLRVVPPAITPVSQVSIAKGIIDHARKKGRRDFRREIQSYLSGTSAATYTSFRRALAACLQTLSATREEDVVLIPSFCSSDYHTVIDRIGLTSRRYDVDPTSLAADVDSLRNQSFEDVLAVVAVNVLGYSSPMTTLETMATDRDTYLVEALGYGLGANYNGKRLGTFGDCSVLNFQQGKPIPVGGGMVVSQTDSIAVTDENRPTVSPNIGVLSGYALFSHPQLYGLYDSVGNQVLSKLGMVSRPSTHPESKTDVNYEPPYRTMSNFQGAVGHSVFEKQTIHRNRRAETAAFYDRELASVSSLTQLTPINGLSDHQWVRYPLLCNTAENRDTLVDELVAAGIQATALYDWPPIDGDTHPGGATLQDRLIALPTHPYVSERDRIRTVTILKLHCPLSP